MTRRHALLAVIAAAFVLAAAPGSAGARRPAAELPPGCHPYSDAGDYACAGLELRYHTSGSGAASSDIWAGQWLFTDEAGNFRLGSCTFNRGLHPRADDPAQPITQAFPNDPGQLKSAYLTWRYGATTDNLTAAALWAIFHYYAQDPAGSARAADPSSPLVPSLDVLAGASGRADLQQRAIELDAEAARFAGPFRLNPDVAGTTLTVRVMANGNVVPGVPVSVDGVVQISDGAGTVTAQVAPGATVRIVASAPGTPAVYLAPPLRPHAFGGQSMITAGPPGTVEAEATVPVPETTTTSTTTTTTVPPTTTTTVAPTTTTVAPTTTTTTTTTSTTTTEAPTTTSTTAPPTTTTPTTTPTTEATTVAPTEAPTTSTPESSTSIVVEVVPPPPAPPTPFLSPPSTLPRTGSTETVAAAATLLLGAGVGALVGLRRRMQAVPATVADEFWG